MSESGSAPNPLASVTEPVTSWALISPEAICSVQWQATRWLGFTPGISGTRSTGRSVSHFVSWRYGQRVWKRHPVGGFDGEGRSPVSRICSRRSSMSGSGTGTADMSARV